MQTAIYVKCHSHRAREKLIRAMNWSKPQCYFSMRKGSGCYGVYIVTEAELPIARAIKGITAVRNPDQYNFLKCW